MRNPNGFGTVYKIKGKRRRPWIARITIGYDENDNIKRLVIGYFEEKKDAIKALSNYKYDPMKIEAEKITLKEVIDRWWKEYHKNLGPSAMRTSFSQLKKFEPLHNLKFIDLKTLNLQLFFDGLESSTQIKNKLKSLLNQIYTYAMKYEIVDKNYSTFIETGKKEIITERKIFTNSEIETLWKFKDVTNVDIVLILIYTGVRVSELLNLKIKDINLENDYFKCGSKTESGKDRLIPINDKIMPLIEARFDINNEYLLLNKKNKKVQYDTFRRNFNNLMCELDLQDHTIHDTRHTFATLISNAGANSTAIKNIMGHSDFKMTEKIYTHKDIEELKKATKLI